MYNILCQNVSVFPLYVLFIRRIDTFWSKSINTFWSGGISTVWVSKIIQERSAFFTTVLNFTKSPGTIFYTKMP